MSAVHLSPDGTPEKKKNYRGEHQGLPAPSENPKGHKPHGGLRTLERQRFFVKGVSENFMGLEVMLHAGMRTEAKTRTGLRTRPGNVATVALKVCTGPTVRSKIRVRELKPKIAKSDNALLRPSSTANGIFVVAVDSLWHPEATLKLEAARQPQLAGEATVF